MFSYSWEGAGPKTFYKMEGWVEFFFIIWEDGKLQVCSRGAWIIRI